MLIRIPKRFYDDCVQCETRVPVIVKETKAHYFIDPDTADHEFEGATIAETWSDFTSRAGYYETTLGFDEWVRPICYSAKATLVAIDKAGRG